MKDRLRELRECLNLSRASFGEKIGVSGDVINNLERGRVEMKELTFNLIVKTYNVSPDWLRSGIGDMFRSDNGPLDDLAEKYDLSDADVILMERFMKLDKRQRDLVTDFISQVAQEMKEKEREAMTTEAAEAAYREALGIVQPQTPSASSITEDTLEAE